MIEHKAPSFNSSNLNDKITATKHLKKVIYILFFCSGFSGLIYEIIWARMLYLTLGSTTVAVSLVLSAFMAGLALGSYYSGKFTQKWSRLLIVYGILEAVIGLFALLSPVLINGLNPVYAWMYGLMQSHQGLLNIVRFFLAFIILLIPTTFMGATLPVLSKYIVRKKSKLGTGIGALYGLNTIGAAAGCFLTGFVFIRYIGIGWTIILAAVLNLLIALISILLSHKLGEKPIAEKTTDTKTPPKKTKEKPSPLKYPQYKIVLIAFALSGFIALGYEVLWTKAIAFFAGNTSYAFSTMLTTFLLGIGLGGMIAAFFSDRLKKPFLTFGIAEILIGFCALASIPMFAKLFYIFKPELYGDSPATPIWMKFVFSLMVILLPTLIMGAVFPIVGRLYTRTLKMIGRSIGDIYSINTVGAIFGSFVAGFIIVPLIGIQAGILLLSILQIIIGMILIASSRETTKIFRYSVIIFTILILVFSASIIPISGRIYSVAGRPAIPPGNTIFYDEGITHIVEVLEDTQGTRHLILDGGVNASTASLGVGLRIHRMMSQLPLLLHENPRSILLIALGSGMTSGATLAFENLQKIDCAEISPDVVSTAGYFAEWNHNIVNSPRFNLKVEDGRNFMLITPDTYDVITAGIIHPKHSAGNAGLYSRDYYEICRAKLNDGGIVCQWAPLNGLTLDEFKIITQTFMSVFPRSSLWFAQSYGSWGNSNALLIGSVDSLIMDVNTLSSYFKKQPIYDDLKEEGIEDIYEFLDCFVAGEKTLREFVGEDTRQTTDDLPILEFGPVEMHYREILTLLSGIREPILPYLTGIADIPDIDSAGFVKKLNERFNISNYCIQGDITHLQKDYDATLGYYGMAKRIDPDNSDLLFHFMDYQTRAINSSAAEIIKNNIGRPDDITRTLNMYQANPNDVEALFRLGYIFQNIDWLNAAIVYYQEVLRLDSNYVQARHNLAVIHAIKGRNNKALEMLAENIKIDPSFSQSLAYSGYVYEKLGDTARAIQFYEKTLKIDPTNSSARTHLTALRSSQ